MPEIPADVREQIKKITFDALNTYDDTLKGSHGSGVVPTHLRICVKPKSPQGNWDGKAIDFDQPSEDMVQQIKWAWEDIANHERMKDLITVEFVDDNQTADITYFSAASTYEGKPCAGLTGGYKNKEGKTCKEVLINPSPCMSSDGSTLFAAWVQKGLYDQPDHHYNPRNPHGQAARIVKHETGHALGLGHFGYDGIQDQRVAGRNPEVDTDTTIQSYRLGKNEKHDFRELDWAALQYLYDPQYTKGAPLENKGFFSLFEEKKGYQR